MSEIFSPGSVPGPAGAPGAAGSLANVKSLTDTLLPNLTNRFDPTQVTTGTIAADGTIAAGGWSVSGLIYCAGATHAVGNIPVRFGDINGTFFALYDANGNFLQTLPSSYFGSSMDPGPGIMHSGVDFPLPGTQTYIRISWSSSNLNQGAYASAVSSILLLAGTSPQTLPGSFVPFGFDTVSDVNEKNAAVLATSNANIASALGGVGVSMKLFAQSVLPMPQGGNRNAFDAARDATGTLNTDGTVTTGGWNIATIFCPGATSFITNVPIRGVPNGQGVCLYDAQGNFLEDISTTTLTSAFTQSNCLVQNVAYALPGTQTFLKFSYSPSTYGTSGFPNAGSAMFFAGNAASPIPSSLPAGAPFIGSSLHQIKTATQLGCAPDGSNNCTALLNAFLATASATNPIKLILDGMFTVDGLVIASAGYTCIEGLGTGTGLTLTTGTTQDGIRIGAYTNAVPYSEGEYNVAAPARTASHILLRNFSMYGGGQVNAGANQPISGAVAHSTFGVILANCSNIMIDNLNFPQNCANYCITLTNVDHARVVNCSFHTVDFVRDGIHIDGPSEDIGIENCDFSTHDDAIALNAPEGYGGDISRVTITNCRFNGALTVLRIYTSVDTAHMPSNNVHRVRQVTVTGCSGTTTTQCFNLGITNGVNPTSDAEQLVDLTVAECSFGSAMGLAALLTPMGCVTFRNVVFAPSSTTAVFWGNPPSIAQLVIDGLTIRRNSDANSAPTAIVGSAGTLGKVVLRNVSVVDTPGSSYAAIPCVVNGYGPIAVLDLENIDMAHFMALVDTTNGFTNIAEMRGAGLLATGTSLADALVDNGWLYLSSNASGAVSLKVGGTAKRLTLA